jgi:plastocyanin
VILVPFALAGLAVWWWWRRSPDKAGPVLRALVRAAAWVFVGLTFFVTVMVGLAVGIDAGAGSRLIALIAGTALGIAWFVRGRVARRAPAQVARVDRIVFLAAFAGYTAVAACWLVVGLLPSLAAAFPRVNAQFVDWAQGDGVFADMALNVTRAARNSSSAVQVLFDYAFSVLNLALGIFLIVKVRHNRTAALLGVGMVGTAVAFNLQSHAATQVLGLHLGGFLHVYHDYAIHVAAGVCYVFALLLFPDGRLEGSARRPHLLALALAFGLLSFVAIEDHTTALVVLFGGLAPVAALSAQSRRFRSAATPEAREQSRLLLFAMGTALAGAVVVLGVTTVLAGRDERFTETTRELAFESPTAGSYIFYCDPHLDEMVGSVIVRAAAPGDPATTVVDLRARANRFDVNEFTLVAERPALIRFTNEDSAKHNVAIYTDARRSEAVVIGELFSGQDLATFTFRVFRLVFALIPIALFVGILRFHLWDVDRLVNRAMVYAALTAVLALVYAAGALIVGLLPGRHFHGGQYALVWVAAAALLFRPVRRRMQGVIDRRFYRQKYDTAQTLARFAANIRDEIELDELSQQLVSVVSDTMHPVYVSLWLREAAVPGPEQGP